MQLSNPSVLSVHLKRLSYSELQVKTNYYCLELLLLLRTQLLGIDQAYSKITMNIYIQKVAIYYHHQNSEASYEYRSKKWKKNQWNNKKMIPWSVNFFSLHCEYCHFVGWSCVMALLSTHSNQFASKCAKKNSNLQTWPDSQIWNGDHLTHWTIFMLCHLRCYVSSLIIKLRYRISSYIFRRNFSYLNLEIVANSNSCCNISFFYLINWIYAAETIQGRKLFKEIL